MNKKKVGHETYQFYKQSCKYNKIMKQKKIENITHNINVDIILKCLWAIKDNDQFYFNAYGKEMIEKCIKQQSCKYNNNMTSKEKAKELFNKFCYAIGTDRTDSGYYTNIIYAKQCALIAVDEIINSNPHSNPFNTDIHSTMQYWIEVKNELTNL